MRVILTVVLTISLSFQQAWSLADSSPGATIPLPRPRPEAQPKPTLLSSMSAQLVKIEGIVTSGERDPAVIKPALEEFAAARSEFESSQEKLNPELAEPIWSTYAALANHALRLQARTEAPDHWNVSELGQKVVVKVPAAAWSNSARVLLPPSMDVVRNDRQSVTVSLDPDVIIGVGLTELMRKANEKNYEMAARCLFAFAYAHKFADAALLSMTSDPNQVRGDLASLDDQPACMNVSMRSIAERHLSRTLRNMQNQLARLEFVDALPDPMATLPQDVRALLHRDVRIANRLEKLEENLALVILDPNLVKERTENDPESVLSSGEVKTLTQALAAWTGPAGSSTGDILFPVDTQLVRDFNSLATRSKTAPVPETDLVRKLRLIQTLFLRDTAAELIAPLTAVDFRGLSEKLVLAAVGTSLSSALLRTSTVLYPDLAEGDRAAVILMAQAAMKRQLGRPEAKAAMASLVYEIKRRVIDGSTESTALKLNFTGYVGQARKIAIALDQATGPNVPDEKLKYDPTLAIRMLTGEIERSSPRVAMWFMRIQNSGAFADFARTQTEIEEHIRRYVKDQAACDVKPFSKTDKVGVFLDGAAKFFGFSGKSGTDVKSDPNTVDCERFVRLTTYAQIRKGDPKMQDMSRVVQALDTYWSVENRKTLLALYRKLLRVEAVDQLKILDLMVDDEKTLSEVIADGAGESQLVGAIGTVKANLRANMRELSQAKNLDELAPLIARSNFLDSSFEGKNGLLRPNASSVTDLFAASLGLRELLKMQKIETLNDLKGQRRESDDAFFAWTQFHGMMKRRLLAMVEAREDTWNPAYRKSLVAIFPIIGLVVARRLMVPLLAPARLTRPAYWIQQRLSEYISSNRLLGAGYFSFLTAAFAADAGVQAFARLPALAKRDHLESAHYFSETSKQGLSAVDSDDRIDQAMDLEALKSEARSRVWWGVGLTALGFLPLLISPTVRAVEGLLPSASYNRYLDWKILMKSNPERLQREIASIGERTAARMRRIANDNPTELRVLGLQASGDPFATLNLETLKKALETTKNAGSDAVKARADQAYRSLIRALYEEMGSYANSPRLINNVYSQIYSQSREAKHYIDDLIEEYNRVVLGIPGGG